MLDLVWTANSHLFLHTKVAAGDNMFKPARGIKVDTQRYLQETWFQRKPFAYLPDVQQEISVMSSSFVCGKSAHVGMVIAKSQIAQNPAGRTISGARISGGPLTPQAAGANKGGSDV